MICIMMMCYREVEILKEEINNLQGVKTKLNTRIKELEEELKKTKEELEKKNTATKEGEEEVHFKFVFYILRHI